MKKLVVIILVVICLGSLSYSFYSADYEINSFVVSNNYSDDWAGNGNVSVKGSLGENITNSAPSTNEIYKIRNGFYNPFKKQFQKIKTTNFQYDNTTLSYPENSSPLEEFEVLYKENINDESIKKATDKLSKINQAVLSSSMTFEAGFFDEEVVTYDIKKPGQASVRVDDLNKDGYVDGTNIRLKTLRGYLFDPKYELWEKAPLENIDVSPDHILLSFSIVAGGVYGVIGKLDTDVDDVHPFPVPFRPNGPKAGVCEGCTGTDDDGIKFDRTPQSGYIEIYTIDGRLVRKLALNENDEEVRIYKRKTWDTKNESGEKVVSGVYIWRVVSENKILGTKNSKTGKLIIIR